MRTKSKKSKRSKTRVSEPLTPLKTVSPEKIAELSRGLDDAIKATDPNDAYGTQVLYLLFVIDEFLFCANPNQIEQCPSIVADLEAASKEPWVFRSNIKRQSIRVQRIADAIETVVGPRPGEDDGAAIRRFRLFEQKLVGAGATWRVAA
jgi:hypothetical protein